MAKTTLDPPHPLFPLGSFEGTDFDDHAGGPDGQRFLLKVPVADDRKPQFQFVTNRTSPLE